MAAAIVADLKLNRPSHRWETNPLVNMSRSFRGSASESVEMTMTLEEHRALMCYWYLNSMSVIFDSWCSNF